MNGIDISDSKACPGSLRVDTPGATYVVKNREQVNALLDGRPSFTYDARITHDQARGGYAVHMPAFGNVSYHACSEHEAGRLINASLGQGGSGMRTLPGGAGVRASDFCAGSLRVDVPGRGVFMVANERDAYEVACGRPVPYQAAIYPDQSGNGLQVHVPHRGQLSYPAADAQAARSMLASAFDRSVTMWPSSQPGTNAAAGTQHGGHAAIRSCTVIPGTYLVETQGQGTFLVRNLKDAQQVKSGQPADYLAHFATPAGSNQIQIYFPGQNTQVRHAGNWDQARAIVREVLTAIPTQTPARNPAPARPPQRSAEQRPTYPASPLQLSVLPRSASAWPRATNGETRIQIESVGQDMREPVSQLAIPPRPPEPGLVRRSHDQGIDASLASLSEGAGEKDNLTPSNEEQEASEAAIGRESGTHEIPGGNNDILPPQVDPESNAGSLGKRSIETGSTGQLLDRDIDALPANVSKFEETAGAHDLMPSAEEPPPASEFQEAITTQLANDIKDLIDAGRARLADKVSTTLSSENSSRWIEVGKIAYGIPACEVEVRQSAYDIAWKDAACLSSSSKRAVLPAFSAAVHSLPTEEARWKAWTAIRGATSDLPSFAREDICIALSAQIASLPLANRTQEFNLLKAFSNPSAMRMHHLATAVAGLPTTDRYQAFSDLLMSTLNMMLMSNEQRAAMLTRLAAVIPFLPADRRLVAYEHLRERVAALLPVKHRTNPINALDRSATSSVAGSL